MEQQLKTLRLQNQALLLQLRQGQQNCHDVINSFKSGNNYFHAFNTSSEQTDVSEECDGSRKIQIVHPKFEALKARESLKSKNKRLVQGMDENTRSITKPNVVMDDSLPTDAIISSQVPNRTETPKSILKRRKIVDDNIKVDSRYQHTPTYKACPRNKHLNFSYSEVDDLEMAKARYFRESNEIESDSDVQDGILNGSYLEERESKKKTRMSEQDLPKGVDSIEELLRERLLFDSGNDRKHAVVVEALKKRPKSILFDETAKEVKQTKVWSYCIFTIILSR